MNHHWPQLTRAKDAGVPCRPAVAVHEQLTCVPDARGSSTPGRGTVEAAGLICKCMASCKHSRASYWLPCRQKTVTVEDAPSNFVSYSDRLWSRAAPASDLNIVPAEASDPSDLKCHVSRFDLMSHYAPPVHNMRSTKDKSHLQQSDVSLEAQSACSS